MLHPVLRVNTEENLFGFVGFFGTVLAHGQKQTVGCCPSISRSHLPTSPHLQQAGECIFAEINKSGIAGAAYKTPEEVQKAVQMLNGSTFEGHTLEVDVWQKKTPEPTAAA